MPPHPLVGGGGGLTRLRLKGWGSPNSNEGTSTVVLYIYKYFVAWTERIGIGMQGNIFKIKKKNSSDPK